MAKKKQNADAEQLADLIGIKIQTIAGELRHANSNKGITQNDMVWYLVHKIDATHNLLITHIQDEKQYLTIETFNTYKQDLKTSQYFRIERIMSAIAIIISIGVAYISIVKP